MNESVEQSNTKRWYVIFASCLIILLLLLAIPIGLAKCKANSEQTSNKLIILLKQSANPHLEDIERLLLAAGYKVKRLDVRAKEPFSILIVQPPRCKPAVIAQSEILKGRMPDIFKYVRTVELDSPARELGDCSPNDPEFSNQWPEFSLHVPQALCLAPPVDYPRMTFLDSGIRPIPGEIEATQIQQFNFAGGAGGVPEDPFDVDTHGTRVASVAVSQTNNANLMAGIATASTDFPAQITMCRTTRNGIHWTSDVIDALSWCTNNQDIRGGPGVVNVSINIDPPDTYNTNITLQFMAQALRDQGDLFVNGSGNAGGYDGWEDPSPDQYIRRVTGTDQGDNRYGVWGPFTGAAPAVSVLTHDGTQLVYSTGTSASTAYWAGSIAYLQSLVPGLTATDADAIIEATATPGQVPPSVYPNLEAAVQSLLGGSPHGGSGKPHKGSHELVKVGNYSGFWSFLNSIAQEMKPLN
jgi:hypothetical protein